MRAATPMFAEIVTYSQQMFAMISLPLFLNFSFDFFQPAVELEPDAEDGGGEGQDRRGGQGQAARRDRGEEEEAGAGETHDIIECLQK